MFVRFNFFHLHHYNISFKVCELSCKDLSHVTRGGVGTGLPTPISATPVLLTSDQKVAFRLLLKELYLGIEVM